MRHVEAELETAGRQLLYDEPHHDGSLLYLPNPAQNLGESFDVLLRAPRAAGVTRVAVRQVHDGEPFGVSARIAFEDEGAQWWQATLTQHNPVVNYRFLTDSGPSGYRWITAAGPVDHDPSDAGDFRSAVGDPGGPRWLDDAVVYQVFPDRFARSGRVDEDLLKAAANDWATLTPWDEEPAAFGPQRGRQLYGGDLYGVAQRLDHLVELGVNVVYLTPFFPAPSNHRYNATSFGHVDPILGGDEALITLVEQAHQRGMKVLGDFTTNHTGSRHEWFVAAQADLASEEAGYYFFGDSSDDYVGWFGVPTLPKVDHRSPELRQRMVTGPEAPVRRFLREPFALDGWRVDVANMTARHREHDDNHVLARDFRTATLSEREDGYVVGEHFHDFRDDLPGDGWHGVMNYAGFAKPMLTWLNNEWPAENWLGLPWPHWPRLTGPSVVATMRDFLAVPWPLLQSSLTLIGSHDTARIRTIVGDPALVEVAVGALMTYPGTPMIWAGDEVGLEGVNGEHGRRAFPWDAADSWEHDTLAAYRSLARLRRTEAALQVGGLRWIFVDDDRIVFVRETESQGVLVCLARASGSPITLPISGLGGHDGQGFTTLFGSGSITSEGEWFTIPGAGPAVHILRWNRRTSSRSTASDTITTTGG